jgi:hypothetical protein
MFYLLFLIKMTNAIMGVSGIANVDLADRCNRKLQCAFVMVLKADESLDGSLTI